MMKYAPMISRSLIALLFIFAGYQKITHFGPTTQFIGSLGVPAASLAAAIVVFIEIVIALAFAYGYRICITGWTLIAFTVLATVLVHNNFAVGDNMIMALKNIAITGGLLAIVTGCNCGKCPISKRKHSS